MSEQKPMPTPLEIYELLKRSSLDTVLVEGKDDIIFYRKIEESLEEIDVDMLPAGNKENVLLVKKMIEDFPISTRVLFVVDKDLWVHKLPIHIKNVVTSCGYSVENDAFCDGQIEDLLTRAERETFEIELDKFIKWYALAVDRTLRGEQAGYRHHPNKILDDDDEYARLCELRDGESYPEILYREIKREYRSLLRGKSLIHLILRQLSKRSRPVKFSSKQIIYLGSSRMGDKFSLIRGNISKYFM
ncbi:DUF4435 domain-containing protein [Komagataeibacter europaeus]|uniref:DUF4435 domain-containing protein n=1 Tax=Komagataeibacter europaeus TaxID=33995 RepID=UPI000B3E772F|nr:DUF4435 domain-containing protein [Komagataeibacter europaeus]